MADEPRHSIHLSALQLNGKFAGYAVSFSLSLGESPAIYGDDAAMRDLLSRTDWDESKIDLVLADIRSGKDFHVTVDWKLPHGDQ